MSTPGSLELWFKSHWEIDFVCPLGMWFSRSGESVTMMLPKGIGGILFPCTRDRLLGFTVCDAKQAAGLLSHRAIFIDSYLVVFWKRQFPSRGR